MERKKKEHLVIFTRYPEPGTTKTRLIPMMGPEGAADLQRQMTEHIISRVKGLSSSSGVSLKIRFEGGDHRRMAEWLGSGYKYHPQGLGDVGRRMERALEDAFNAGMDSAVIIGTDIPGITHAIIHKAFLELGRKDLVLGPAGDGGYYLIGLRQDAKAKSLPELFRNIKWGSADVLDSTIKIAERSGLGYATLEVLEDVDRPDDLDVWERAGTSKEQGDMPGSISVIIPAINEAGHILKTLSCVGRGSNIETIVVDGGSHDDTVRLSESMGARVIKSLPPRALQMNLGAAAATGDALLFLHADTCLPERYSEQILHCLSQPGVAAGAFELRLDADGFGLRIVESLANFRSRRMGMPYGDQALFIKKDTFNQIEGFPQMAIMEDFELVRRIKKIGKVVTLPDYVISSARRWRNMGILKTTLINQIVIAAYYLGISPDTIARLYRRDKAVD